MLLEIFYHILFLCLVLLMASATGQAPAFYCSRNGSAVTVSGKTEGDIYTRYEGDIHYQNNQNCEWIIDAGEGRRISMSVVSSDLQWAPAVAICHGYDHVSIKDDPSKELWFCGQQFTAADITLCILLARLDILGLGTRYHSNEKRPKLHLYWQQARKRSSVNRVTVNVLREILKMKLREGARTVLPILGGVVTVGLAAGLAFLFAKKK